jgi:hypothetical protein
MSRHYTILISLFILLSIFILPWWVFLISAIVTIWFLHNYYFAIFAGFIADLLYASPLILRDKDSILHLNFLPDFLAKWPFTLVMLVSFLLFDLIKKRVRM